MTLKLNGYSTALYDGTTPVEPPATPEQGYHLTEDLADRAVSWVRQQKALMPDEPFFVYFAPGATHAPHHVPKEWADRYQGAFADGWEVQRERTFARQKELGVIPADAELTTRHAEIPAWDDMPDELKPVVYNVLGIQEFATEAEVPIPAGTHQVRIEFAYDGGGLAKGGNVTLYYDADAVGTGRVAATQPMIFSADETTDIGYESGTTVTPDYTTHTSRFTGKINWVQIDLGTDDHDHFIDPEERLRIAMARQ
jgi:sulfatase-like protein